MPARARNLVLLFTVLWLVATPARAAPKVVATFLPVHGIVAAVMAGVGEPALLIDTAVSPHTFALTPSKRRLLEDADIVFGIGPQLEAGMWGTITSLPGDHVALVEIAGDRLIGGGADERGIDDQSAHSTEVDPHIWLDTGIAADLGDAVAAALTRADPGNADLYNSNAAAFRAGLAGLEGEITAALADGGNGAAISYHDAFSYFARQWQLDYGFVVLQPDRAPAVRTVARLRDLAAGGGIACLMTEPQYRPDLIAALAADYELPVIEIDPVGGSIPPGPDFYPALMRSIGAGFAACLQR